MIDVEKLRALAALATPGPYIASPGGRYGSVVSVNPTVIEADVEDRGADHVRAYGGSVIGESMMPCDREYLVALPPETLVELLDLLERSLVHTRAFAHPPTLFRYADRLGAKMVDEARDLLDRVAET